MRLMIPSSTSFQYSFFDLWLGIMSSWSYGLWQLAAKYVPRRGQSYIMTGYDIIRFDQFEEVVLNPLFDDSLTNCH